MAELSPEDHQDLVDAAKARDQRLALIEQALDVEAELRDSPTWRYLKHRIAQERGDIVDEFAAAAPTDLAVITKLQARAISVTSIPRWISELLSAGAAAEQQINIEDGRLPADS